MPLKQCRNACTYLRCHSLNPQISSQRTQILQGISMNKRVLPKATPLPLWTTSLSRNNDEGHQALVTFVPVGVPIRTKVTRLHGAPHHCLFLVHCLLVITVCFWYTVHLI
jgi:hypothetical protein